MTHANDPTAIALASGLSVVCATCTKWKMAVDRGLDRCLAVDACGSPIVGDTFHEYEGPIVDFVKQCFACGGRSTKAVRVKGHVRVIGACDKHAALVAELAPKEPRRLPILPTTTIVSPGSEVLAESLAPKAPKHRSLAQALWEMERGTFKPDG